MSEQQKPTQTGDPGSAIEQARTDDPFRAFLVALATDPATLGRFIKDPDATMKAASVRADDQGVLKSGSPAAIHARLTGQTSPAAAPVTVLVVDMASGGSDAAGGTPSVRFVGALSPHQTFFPQIFPQQVVHPQIFPQQVFPQQVHPQIFPQQVFPQIFPQQVHPQIFPQQVFPQQVFPQIFPQQVFPQIFPQQVFPQQVVHPIFPQIFPQQVVHPIFPQQVVHPIFPIFPQP